MTFLTRNFLFFPSVPWKHPKDAARDEYGEILNDIYSSAMLFSNEMKSVDYIGPFRSAPERTYLFSGESPSGLGPHGEKAVHILAADEPKRGSKKLGIAEFVSEWLERLGIGSSLSVKGTYG